MENSRVCELEFSFKYPIFSTAKDALDRLAIIESVLRKFPGLNCNDVYKLMNEIDYILDILELYGDL